jgi:ABC-type branched-subunit amino acid transport system substrate-binding protein
MTARLRSILAGAALVGGLTGLASTATPPRSRLIIGLLLPPNEADALSLRQGVTLGIARAEAEAGMRVQLVVRGRNGPWGSDATEAARLVSDDGARGLIAPSSGTATHLVLQVSGRTAVPVVSLCPDASVTRTGVPWTVRVVPSALDQARALFTGLQPRGAGQGMRWVAVVPGGRAGRPAARDLMAAARDAGCQLIQPIEADAEDLAAGRLSDRLLKFHPDAVLLWLDGEPAAQLARRLRAAGFKGTLAGPGWLRSAGFVARAGGAAEGVVVPAVRLTPDEERNREGFAADFRRHFGREPDPTAAMACDAAALLVRLLLASGTRPAHVAFPVVAAVRGVTGKLRFDRDGNRLVSLRLMRCRAGGFVAGGAPVGRGIQRSRYACSTWATARSTVRKSSGFVRTGLAVESRNARVSSWNGSPVKKMMRLANSGFRRVASR